MSAVASREFSPLADEQTRLLPAWPIFVLFVGYPIWWVLGLGAFVTLISAIPMLALLIQLRKVELPPAFWLWIGFVVSACFAAIELDTGGRAVGFGVRVANYVGSAIVFLYLYNARERLSNRRIMYALIVFFAFVVVGGYLGILVPHASLPTPVERLLPVNIRNNGYVQSLVHPHFAEVQHPYGSPQTFYRPSAPFTYTNGWGVNAALLVPLMISAFTAFRRRRAKVLLVLLLLASAPPAAATLNRGMFLAIGLVLVYGSIRLAIRGRVVALIVAVGVGVLGVTVALWAGVLEQLQERLHYSQTNLGRQTIYREAFDGALQSPLFGHGAPRPSQTLDISIGTQGQVWNVMFSYGFLALGFFLGWFALAVLQSARAQTQPGLWVHATLFIVCFTFFFYGYDGVQLTVAMTAAALAYRNRRAEAERSPPDVSTGDTQPGLEHAAVERPVPLIARGGAGGAVFVPATPPRQ
jgi:hypothetical protein